MDYFFVYDGIQYFVENDHKHIRRSIDNKTPASQRRVAMCYLKENNIVVDEANETTHSAVRKIVNYLSASKEAIAPTPRTTFSTNDKPPVIEDLISVIQLTEQSLNQAEEDARNDWWYGSNQEILEDLLNQFPNNIDDSNHGISKKVKYLDNFYSTHLRSLGKYYTELTVSKILSINDFDQRLRNGDNQLVTELMAIDPLRNEFSFATKYCSLHNPDYYYICDSVNQKVLPKLYRELAQRAKKIGDVDRYKTLLEYSSNVSKWIINRDYEKYNNAITFILSGLEKKVRNAKRKLDWLLWYNFKDLV